MLTPRIAPSEAGTSTTRPASLRTMSRSVVDGGRREDLLQHARGSLRSGDRVFRRGWEPRSRRRRASRRDRTDVRGGHEGQVDRKVAGRRSRPARWPRPRPQGGRIRTSRTGDRGRGSKPDVRPRAQPPSASSTARFTTTMVSRPASRNALRPRVVEGLALEPKEGLGNADPAALAGGEEYADRSQA